MAAAGAFACGIVAVQHPKILYLVSYLFLFGGMPIIYGVSATSVVGVGEGSGAHGNDVSAGYPVVFAPLEGPTPLSE